MQNTAITGERWGRFRIFNLRFMDLNNLKNKKIAILGLGIENEALVKFLLAKKIKCEITVCDNRDKDKLGARFKELEKKVNWKLGKDFNKGLEEFDILFRSPGWPIFCPGIKSFLKAKSYKPQANLSSPMKLFFDLCPTKNIIGVTGTKGKGTTSTLIYDILKAAGKKAWLGGNIGVAPFAFINKVKKTDWVVLELSSFQLEDMDVGPKIAVITNFYPEHLSPADPNNPNYHRTLRLYWEAKMNIAKWQNKNNFVVLNSKLQLKIKNLKSEIVYFIKSDLPSKLIGEHNKENVAAAAEVAKIIGIKKSIMEKAVKNFKGLEHRLEFVKSIKGVKYYNDTFATTPESTVTALNSFVEPIILIAGGAEKKSNFKNLAKTIKRKVKFAVLLDGQATPRLKKELIKAGFFGKNIKLAYNIKEAVTHAREIAAAGDIVLLSTACASFGMFKNYKERGELFKEEVRKI